MKTPPDKRELIIDVVKKKCMDVGRPNFDFFQVAYKQGKDGLYLRKLFVVLKS